MTHLLATLLTGGRFSAMKTGPSAENRGTPPQHSFDEMLQERTEPAMESRTHQSDSGKPEGERTGDRNVDSGTGESGAGNGSQTQDAQTSRVTLLGVRMGAGIRVPSLTFMMPEGAGPEDMAAAVRTQVLRQVANRQLDPGSLDNLRLAISSRELGQVDVDLKASGERLEVKIVTAGREAESVIRRTSGELKEALLARTDRFRDVEVKVENRAAAEEESPERDGRRGQGFGQGNGEPAGQQFEKHSEGNPGDSSENSSENTGDPESGPLKEG